MLTDMVQSGSSLMLRCLLGWGWGDIPLLGVPAASVMLACETQSTIFILPFFSPKVKIRFGFLLVTENKYPCRSFIKAKWQSVNVCKAGDAYIWVISLNPALERQDCNDPHFIHEEAEA